MSETTHDSGQPVPEAPVERFNPFIDELDSLVPDPGMIEVTDGGWVRYEDYEKLKAEYDLILTDLNKFSAEMDEFIKRRFLR